MYKALLMVHASVLTSIQPQTVAVTPSATTYCPLPDVRVCISHPLCTLLRTRIIVSTAGLPSPGCRNQ